MTDQTFELNLAPDQDPESVDSPIPFGCGQGHCMICAVKVIHGHDALIPPTDKERYTLRRDELEQHVRLACQLRAHTACTLTLSTY